MNEILDDFEKEPQKNVSKTFSRLAFGCAMMSLGLYVYTMRNFVMIPPSSVLPTNRFAFGILILITITGTVFSIVSYLRSEEMALVKIIGALLNFTLMGLLLLFFLFGFYI